MPNSSVTFTILITARDKNDGDCAAFKISGLVKRDTLNNTTLSGIFENNSVLDDSNWDAFVSVDDENEALIIKVVSDVEDTVRWNAEMTYSEARF